MHRNHVHVRFIEGVNGSHVAPVAVIALGRPRHLIGHEVIDMRLPTLHKVRDNIAAHIVGGVLILFVLQEGVNKRLRRKDIVAHRGIAHIRIIRRSRWVRRLFHELRDGSHAIGLDASERRCLRARHANAGHRTIQPRSNVLFYHLRRIHAIDMVCAEDDDVVRILVIDEVKRLHNGIRGAVVPPLAAALLGRHRGNVLRRRPC